MRMFWPISLILLFASIVATAAATPVSNTLPGTLRLDTSARLDPYKNFRFRLQLNGKYVAGFAKMATLQAAQATVPRQGSPHTAFKAPNKFVTITLERGVTHDADFENWANSVNAHPGTQAGDVRNLVIETLNEAGQKAGSLAASRCRATEFQAAPDLDVGGHTLAISNLKLECESFSR